MTKEIIWTSGATSDLQEVYNSFQELSAEVLISKLNHVMPLLSAFPLIAGIYHGKVRKYSIGPGNRFGLFYTVEANRIIVVGFLDLRQDPKTLYSTLRQRTFG